VAIHEAGHAAGYIHFGKRCGDVRLLATDGGGGVESPGGRYNPTQYATWCLAGPMAEQRLTGIPISEQTGSRIDICMALNALNRTVRPFHLASLLPAVDRLVCDEWQNIARMAEALLLRGHLGYEDIVALCQRQPATWLSPRFPALGPPRSDRPSIPVHSQISCLPLCT
jgi:hypothetical protein